MNTPSVKDGNYHWRMQPGVLTPNLAKKLATLAEVKDRLPAEFPVPQQEDFLA